MKTAIMFSTSLAFVIFAGLGFTLLGHNIKQLALLGVGSDLLFFAVAAPLNEELLRPFLDSEVANSTSYLSGYSFATYSLDAWRYARDIDLAALAGYPDYDQSLYGLEANFLTITNPDFFNAVEYDEDIEYTYLDGGQPDVVASLFDLTQRRNLSIPPSVLSQYAP